MVEWNYLNRHILFRRESENRRSALKKTIAIIAAAMLVLVVAAAVASEDWRGDNRLSGYVVDKNTGAPVKGAKVSLRIQKGSTGGPDITSDGGGKWAVLGLASGSWNIDVQAPGYTVRKIGPISLSEGQRLPPIKVDLEPEVVTAQPANPAEAPQQEVRIGGKTVSKDVADAVEAGNTLVGQKKFKEAVVEYEKAAAVLTDLQPLQLALARAYYGAGDMKKATAAMDGVYKSDPANTQYALLYANILLENGQLAEGKEVIEKLPTGAITEPTPLINIGIIMMNKKQPAAAVDYFTKAIAIAPNAADGYYYRGLAHLQAGKAKEAKPDLQKVVELAPDSDQGKEAKEYLKSIK
jgi:predicted Zn-dependent protease